MLLTKKHVWMLGIALALSSTSSLASMRCGTSLVEEGDSSAEVLRKCGQPSSKQVITPATGQNGRPFKNAVMVENWKYGPDGGMYRTLRFIDGKLVEISTSRK